MCAMARQVVAAPRLNTGPQTGKGQHHLYCALVARVPWTGRGWPFRKYTHIARLLHRTHTVHECSGRAGLFDIPSAPQRSSKPVNEQGMLCVHASRERVWRKERVHRVLCLYAACGLRQSPGSYEVLLAVAVTIHDISCHSSLVDGGAAAKHAAAQVVSELGAALHPL